GGAESIPGANSPHSACPSSPALGEAAAARLCPSTGPVSSLAAMLGALCLGLLLAVLATPGLARPDPRQLGRAPGSEEQPRRSSGTDPVPVRRDLLGALSPDQKHLMAKFLPHIYAGRSRSRASARPDPLPCPGSCTRLSHTPLPAQNGSRAGAPGASTHGQPPLGWDTAAGHTPQGSLGQ
ncbi:gastrin/cholecystokinin-like peptide, partial [Chelydra serpentina]